MLYCWQDDGWQRGSGGTVAHLCPRPAFSHVVAYSGPYTQQMSALCDTADSLLDSAS